LIAIGVQWFDENDKCLNKMYISDRCGLYRNDSFLHNLSYNFSNCQFIENMSQIALDCDNRQSCPTVEISHLRNGRLVKDNQQRIALKGFEQQTFGCYAKMFIEQYYGNGVYYVEEKETDQKVQKYNANMEKFNKMCKKTRHRKSI